LKKIIQKRFKENKMNTVLSSAPLFFTMWALFAYALLLIANVLRPRAIAERLIQDKLGLLILVGSVAVVALGYIVGDVFKTCGLAVGGFMFGIGVLIALPNKVTPKVMSLRNALGVSLLIIALYGVLYRGLYALIGEPVSQLVKGILDRWTNEVGLWLMVGVACWIVGLLFIKGVRMKNKVHNSSSTHTLEV
jgi:tetrahydromethanopterin S-methyltransferase subunit E